MLVLKKILLLILAIIFCFIFLQGCKDNKSEPSAQTVSIPKDVFIIIPGSKIGDD